MQQEASTLVIKAANTATYGGSGSAIFFGMTANEFAAIGGLVIAIIGLAVNVWYKHKHYMLARRRAELEGTDL